MESQLHFTIETNLRNEFLAERASVFKKLRYETRLIYMLLPNIARSMDRVNQRVKQKGHYVDPESIKLNFEAGLENLRKVAPRFDRLMLVSAFNDFAIKTQPRLLLTLTNGITKFRSKEIPKWSEKIVYEVELAVYRHWK